MAVEDPAAREIFEARTHGDLTEGRNGCGVLVVTQRDRLSVDGDDLVVVDVDVKRVPGTAGVANDPLLGGIEPDDRVVPRLVKRLAIDPEAGVLWLRRKRAVLEREA